MFLVLKYPLKIPQFYIIKVVISCRRKSPHDVKHQDENDEKCWNWRYIVMRKFSFWKARISPVGFTSTMLFIWIDGWKSHETSSKLTIWKLKKMYLEISFKSILQNKNKKIYLKNKFFSIVIWKTLVWKKSKTSSQANNWKHRPTFPSISSLCRQECTPSTIMVPR